LCVAAEYPISTVSSEEFYTSAEPGSTAPEVATPDYQTSSADASLTAGHRMLFKLPVLLFKLLRIV
jgi:hypothetical protein